MSIDLDKRIIKGKKPLSAFDELESKYIGTDCFFSDKPSDFADLLKCPVGKLMSLDAVSGMFGASKNNSYAVFYFCLPCEWVKESEKKYRAFTIKEFQQKYSVGSVLKIRQKQNRFTESVVQYVGYKVYEDRIYLGITDFTLDELFENFEMIESQSDTWQPFGVIDEDKE